MTTRTLALIVAAWLAAAFSTDASAQTLDKIRKQGSITLGYIDGAAPFSYTDGNGDPQGFSVELCRAVAERIPGALFEVMEEEAHQPFQEAPDEWNARVDAFWREVDARSR